MRRGVSAGGGQSSLGYLFGSGESSNDSLRASRSEGQISNNISAASLPPLDNTQQIQADTKSAGSSQAAENSKQGPTGTHDSKKNNYYRPDGQNCGNFITVWYHYADTK